MAQLSLNKNYISVYDGVFSEGSCDKLIHFFESNKDKTKETDLGFCKFRELPFSISPQNESNVAKVLKPYVQRYKQDNNISDYVWPERYKMEGIRFKKYMPNSGDGFEEHADAVNVDSCTRFLVMFVYLSNNNSGHTTFPTFNIEVEPKQGRLLMFPPNWCYPHIGEQVKDKPKYIMGSYCHYAE